MDAIAGTHHARLALDRLIGRLRNLIDERAAHPSRTVVLLPFFHLLGPAQQAWARAVPDGFAPRFETTQTWSASRGFIAAPQDFTGDAGRDLVAARAWLDGAGLGARAQLLAGRLVEAASELVPVVSAIAPNERGDWAVQARRATAASFDTPLLSLESAIAQVAIEWVAASGFPGDRLFDAATWRDVELAVVVEGSRPEPLTDSLVRRHEDVAVRIALESDAPLGSIALHAAANPADEAERAAACVVRHVREQRLPVALAAVDRVLTRRVRAMLESAGVAIRDEDGWKLSTTRAAANVIVALKACTWNAGADAVIDWMKNSPALGERSVLALERRIRRGGVREWRALRPDDVTEGQQALLESVNAWRDSMQSARPLQAWLAALHQLLESCGMWERLEGDAAGALVIDALRLREGARQEFAQLPGASRRWSLAEFTAWADDALEARSFKPPSAADAQVVILPFNQLFGREFAALVLPGCDEVRLPSSPDPGGAWTPRQRGQIGLPTREALEAQTRAAWRHALQTPVCDILWRHGDDSGESLLASPLVQALALEGIAAPGADARQPAQVQPLPTSRPAAVANRLVVEQLSASSYEDLRRCPYRFFALRQLGLQEPEEIDTELDKRDFGTWLHHVLRRFHESLAADASPAGGRTALMDSVADEVTRMLRLGEGDFLPFRAAWPQVRDGYLSWLSAHEAREGAQFRGAELDLEAPLDSIRLVGRIDRVDDLPGGAPLVMDYKTESQQVTRDRVRDPAEDTQLAFYAALLRDDRVRAAYVNVGERGETRLIEQPEVIAARDGLLRGIAHDMARVHAGAAMPALGEGVVCEFCSARGLCRRDFWE